MIRTSILLFGTAMGVLGGLASCAVAPVAAEEALGKIPVCVPHEEALQRLADANAVIIEEVPTPYPNHLVVFLFEGNLYAVGVDRKCFYSPSTFIGHMPTKGTPA